jgi:exonuclease III
MLGVISVNANGVRAALKRGGFDWIKSQLDSGNAEVVCLQEVSVNSQSILRPFIYSRFMIKTIL